MANYAVDDFITSIGTIEEVMAELETKLETYDTAKVIRLIEVKNVGADFKGVLIIDA